MFNSLDLMLSVLLLAYAVVLVWYIRSVIVSKHRPITEHGSTHHGKRKRKRLPGKKCPDCNQVIDARRTVCHHCGHKFEIEPGSEPHPAEVKARIREPGPGQAEED